MATKFNKEKLERAILQGQIKAARELAKELPEVIRDRVRGGMGLNGPLKSLSESYIKTRTRLRKSLSKFTDPEKSNLTATGQMLSGIVGEASRTVVRIFIKENRKKELSGEKKTNKEVREYVEKDRPFFGLTKTERKLVEKTAAEIIKKEITKVFK